MDNRLKLRAINFIVIIGIALALTVAMVSITSVFRDYLLEQRFKANVQTVEARCDLGITDIDSFRDFIERVDTIYNVFAAVYDSNHNIISRRHPDITAGRTVFFDPFAHTDLIEAVSEKNTGIITVPFLVVLDNGKEVRYPTPVFFRIVPYFDDNIIVIVATPFIGDTIQLPDFYYPVWSIVFVLVLSGGFIILILKI